jgi:beta-phosphoglucomutase-like phosphatase (HAD superfamily)
MNRPLPHLPFKIELHPCPPPPLQALIFDVDGTLADTESAHLAAFNQAFAEMGMDWVWDEASVHHAARYLRRQRAHPALLEAAAPTCWRWMPWPCSDTVDRLHELKTAAYEAAVNDGAVSLRPGVLKLMDEALAQGLQLAIATTTSPVNIAALMRHADRAGLAFELHGNRRRVHCTHQEAASAGVPADAGCAQAAARRVPGARRFQQRTARCHGCRAGHHHYANYLHGAPRLCAALRVVPDLSQVNLARLRQWHAEKQNP